MHLVEFRTNIKGHFAWNMSGFGGSETRGQKLEPKDNLLPTCSLFTTDVQNNKVHVTLGMYVVGVRKHGIKQILSSQL